MRSRLRTTVVATGLTGVLTLGALAQTQSERKLELSFPADGLVTLVAADVTARDILAEWTRQTGAVFVNAEKMPAEPLTLQFENMPQARVIDSILRSAAGYLLAPAGGGPVATSSVASVYIIPTSRATSTGAYNAPPVQTFAPQVLTPGSPNDEIPPVTPPTEQAPPQPEQPQPNRPTYLGTPGGIVPIVPVNPTRGGGAGSGGTTGGGTTGGPPPPPPPPTGSGSGS